MKRENREWARASGKQKECAVTVPILHEFIMQELFRLSSSDGAQKSFFFYFSRSHSFARSFIFNFARLSAALSPATGVAFGFLISFVSITLNSYFVRVVSAFLFPNLHFYVSISFRPASVAANRRGGSNGLLLASAGDAEDVSHLIFVSFGSSPSAFVMKCNRKHRAAPE